MGEKVYEPNIYEVKFEGTIMVVASNPAHAEERLKVLFNDRITQYTHPDDEPPKFKVVGVVRNVSIVGEPKRKTIVEKHL